MTPESRKLRVVIPAKAGIQSSKPAALPLTITEFQLELS